MMDVTIALRRDVFLPTAVSGVDRTDHLAHRSYGTPAGSSLFWGFVGGRIVTRSHQPMVKTELATVVSSQFTVKVPPSEMEWTAENL